MDYRTSAELPQPDRSMLIVALWGQIFGIDRATGEVRWQQTIPGGGDVFLAVGFGVVVASANNALICCLDYLTGELRWAQPTQSTGRATILLEPEHIVCAKSGYIDCFAPNGALLWRQPLKGAGLGGVALGYPGNVAQADANQRA